MLVSEKNSSLLFGSLQSSGSSIGRTNIMFTLSLVKEIKFGEIALSFEAQVIFIKCSCCLQVFCPENRGEVMEFWIHEKNFNSNRSIKFRWKMRIIQIPGTTSSYIQQLINVFIVVHFNYRAYLFVGFFHTQFFFKIFLRQLYIESHE